MAQAAQAPTTNPSRAKLTQERLRELLTYDPATGLWRWRVNRYRVRAGNVAGTPDKDGYVHIKIDQQLHKGHRLAWFWMTGAWPDDEIDHRDLNKANNRWKNLRPGTKTQNMRNTRVRGAVPLKGVYFDRRRQHFVAQITFDERHIYLGSFKTADEAHAAYAKAALEMFGEFARIA